ncbi:MAG: tetratricopeptide repeat protein, partial [Muribaculaceae bacterium]|nr:tetratricopeptide repeat protein [Muribaculaceae bacterium]
MLHKFILFISFVIALAPSMSASTDLIQEADQAYLDDDFENALELYLQSAEEDGTSSNLYYNIGNCYYRLDMPGKAIVNYERALKLDPSNKDAATNLAFVNSRIIDKPVDNLSLSEKIGQRVVNTFSADAWAWITFSIFVLFICAAAGYIFM